MRLLHGFDERGRTPQANESIGDVNDVLLDTSGKIASVIVVAISFENLKFAKDKDNDLVVTTNVTKETLQATPAYTKPNQ